MAAAARSGFHANLQCHGRERGYSYRQRADYYGRAASAHDGRRGCVEGKPDRGGKSRAPRRARASIGSSLAGFLRNKSWPRLLSPVLNGSLLSMLIEEFFATARSRSNRIKLLRSVRVTKFSRLTKRIG